MAKRKVLIIDDEVDFCILLKYYLTKKNCEVNVSNTLKEGLAAVHSTTPDIVILDNNLPDGFGWQSAKNIFDIVPGVHLFLISANTSNKVDLENKNFQVVEKPISISQIDNFLK